MRFLPVLLAVSLLVLPGMAAAQDDAPIMPPPIRAMLDAALESGNEAEVATIVKYARIADPASADVVLAIAEHWRADRAAGRDATLRQASFLDLWKGRAQLGGFLTTGNSNTAGVTASVNLVREGLNWRHKFAAQVDYQESLGIATREHYFASYEPNYKFSDRAYIYGSGQYESDRFLGYFDRFSTSAGIGYSAIRRPRLTLDVELGPAYRHTSFTDRTVQDSIAGRGSLNIAWKLTNGLSITQISSAYLQRYNSTISSATALNAKLIGPLSAQVSYNVQYESEPPVRSVSTDTTSRASLIYSF